MILINISIWYFQAKCSSNDEQREIRILQLVKHIQVCSRECWTAPQHWYFTSDSANIYYFMKFLTVWQHWKVLSPAFTPVWQKMCLQFADSLICLSSAANFILFRWSTVEGWEGPGPGEGTLSPQLHDEVKPAFFLISLFFFVLSHFLFLSDVSHWSWTKVASFFLH